MGIRFDEGIEVYMEFKIQDFSEQIAREIFIKLNSMGNIEHVTSNCIDLLGYTSDGMKGRNFQEFILEGNSKDILGKEEGQLELMLVHKNGSILRNQSYQ
ncbi:PAS domain-containing protein [Caldisalinibacter kiritimatiensis]|uniref:Uncharacterized protein n=1 Tax=Caldisalinibacter kiritimatiensis TaxID=1304284 RepID=R1CND8_9FIRM|nr:PAS domain-containing protein [Caldisalinibacter kiritimatiensis]EOD00226.1 hypothetical protein L21TH_1700 [Caldisalinibacter kiritimatiensis]